MKNEKLEFTKRYCQGEITRAEVLSVLKTAQNLAKYLAKLGFSPRTHVMTSCGFIAKLDPLWGNLHKKYLQNEITLSEIANQYALSSEYVRELFHSLGFEKKTKEEIQKAKEKTCLINHGAKNPSQVDSIKKKKEETCLKNWGVTNPALSNEIETKKQEDYLKRSGYVCALQDPKCREKGKSTLLENLGVDNPAKSSEVLQQKSKRYNEKTGYDHPFQNPLVKENIAKRNLSNLGYVNPAFSPECKLKAKDTTLLKLGVPYAMQNKEVSLRAKEAKLHKKALRVISLLESRGYALLEQYEGLQNKDSNYKHLSWRKYQIKHKCGCVFLDDIYRLPRCPECYPVVNKRSLNEYYFEEYLNNLGESCNHLKNHLREGKNTFDLDIHIPDKNIGFEINGLYYHSLHDMGKSSVKGDYLYHSKKTALALKQGIKLYHIWDFYDLEIVLSKIKVLLNKVTSKVFARNTCFLPISKKEAYRFLSQTHLYGSVPCHYAYGLYHKEQLVQVLTYTRRNGFLELSRSATILDTQVVGGFSKLLKNSLRLLKSNGYSEIITYADKDWSPSSTDTVYAKAGFEFLGDTGPSLMYTDFKQVFSRQKFQKFKLQGLFPETYNPELTAHEILALNKIYPLYTAGNWKYKITF